MFAYNQYLSVESEWLVSSVVLRTSVQPSLSREHLIFLRQQTETQTRVCFIYVGGFAIKEVGNSLRETWSRTEWLLNDILEVDRRRRVRRTARHGKILRATVPDLTSRSVSMIFWQEAGREDSHRERFVKERPFWFNNEALPLSKSLWAETCEVPSCRIDKNLVSALSSLLSFKELWIRS